MLLKKFSLILLFTLGSSLATATPISFGSDSGAGGFLSWAAANSFTKSFGGNVRWGNGAANGDWEYAIVNGSDSPIVQAQTAWSSGSNSHDVSFGFDGAANASLDLSGIGSLNTGVAGNGINTMLLRVRDSAADFTLLDDICVDLDSTGAGCDYTFSSLVGDSNAEYWGVINPGLAGGFTVSAGASLIGPKSAGSDPMYQFKVGTTVREVPEPSLVFLLGLGLMLLVVSQWHGRAKTAV